MLMRVPVFPFFVFFFVLFVLMAGVPVAGGHGINEKNVLHRPSTVGSNSCTITWRRPSAKPNTVFSMPVPNNWALGSAVADDLGADFAGIDDLDMDDSQFELYRIDRIRLAIQSAECIASDWPELDLQWCLADWHSGKLLEESK
jgi:hypothetical protein